jgi:hypothetical protein
MKDKLNLGTNNRLLDPIPKNEEIPTVVGRDEFYDCTQKNLSQQVFGRKHLSLIIAKYAVQPDDIHYATGKHPLSFSFFFVDKKVLKFLETYKENIEKDFGYTEIFGLTPKIIMQRNSVWRNMAANALQKRIKIGELSVVEGQIVCENVNFGGSIVLVWKSRPRSLAQKAEIESVNAEHLELIDEDEIESIQWSTEENALEVNVRWVKRFKNEKWTDEPAKQILWEYNNSSTERGEFRVTPDLGEIEAWRKYWKKSAPNRWNYALVFPCDFTDKKIQK